MNAPLILKAMRPRQWIKNLLLFAGLIFAQRLLDPISLMRAIGGFGAFCLASGSIYLLNDVIDYPRDRLHPRKCKRPIASGALGRGEALRSSLVVMAVAAIFAFFITPYFGVCLLAYLLMMVAYTLLLKNVFLVDTIIVAMGFIIRAVSGVIILRRPDLPVELTSWFVICVMFLSLLLAFCKRRSERTRLSEGASDFRPVLEFYTDELTGHAIAICAGGALLSYTLYATGAENTWLLLASLPMVIYGIFRYLYLVFANQDGEAPELVITRDLPLAACVVMWLMSMVVAYLPS